MLWYAVWWDFENVSFSDEKDYACTAKNRIGINKQRFYLSVTPKSEYQQAHGVASVEYFMIDNLISLNKVFL